MAQAFSTRDKDTYIDAEEVEAGSVTLTSETPESTLTITVTAEDLARALITASPSFALEVGELAKQAIVNFLGQSDEEVGIDPTAG